MSSTEAQIHEVFSSIQGEGIYIGERQIFIRFLMCNLSCAYCDSRDSLVPQKTFRVEETPGKRDFKLYNNPASVDQLSSFIGVFNQQKKLHQSVSFTGGEPLLQVDLLKNLIPKIKLAGLNVYLETNGTMPERLAEILDLVDIIAMDVKLPSMTGSSDRLAEHKKCIQLAKDRNIFLKMVFGKESKPIEIENAAKMISEVNADIPLVLQPVTPAGEIKHGPSAEQTLSFHSIAKRHLNDVRVIPQVHKMMGQL